MIKKTNSINFTGVKIKQATYMKRTYGLFKESIISWVVSRLFRDQTTSREGHKLNLIKNCDWKIKKNQTRTTL